MIGGIDGFLQAWRNVVVTRPRDFRGFAEDMWIGASGG